MDDWTYGQKANTPSITVKSGGSDKERGWRCSSELTAVGDKNTVTVQTENKIRSALGGGGYQITKNDGSQSEGSALLPSAFFTIEKQDGVFVIRGGGFGHGIGMSQNGANEMAKQGEDLSGDIKAFSIRG